MRRPSVEKARLVISPGCWSENSTRPSSVAAIFARRPDRNATRLPFGLATMRTAVLPMLPMTLTDLQVSRL
jgi:hypothetical protein